MQSNEGISAGLVRFKTLSFLLSLLCIALMAAGQTVAPAPPPGEEAFGLDMDLVQRIEVVRGPSSALYGSNGMFATINVVTRSPVDHTKARFSTETDSFGEKKAQLASSMYLGHGANLLVSASVFNNSGQTLFFPEYDSPQTLKGVARGVDGERGYHTF